MQRNGWWNTMDTTERELCSLHTLARTEEGTALWLTYKLLSGQEGYGILCYQEGVDLARHPRAAAAVRDYCVSLEKAEKTLRELAVRQVCPVHLAEVLLEG